MLDTAEVAALVITVIATIGSLVFAFLSFRISR